MFFRWERAGYPAAERLSVAVFDKDESAGSSERCTPAEIRRLTCCPNEDRSVWRSRQCIPTGWRCTTPNQGSRFIELGEKRTTREVARAQIRRAAEITNDYSVIGASEVHVHTHQVEGGRAKLFCPNDIASGIELHETEVINADGIHGSIAEVYGAIEVEGDVHVAGFVENAGYSRRNIASNGGCNGFAPRRIALTVLFDDIEHSRLSGDRVEVTGRVDDASKAEAGRDVEDNCASGIIFHEAIAQDEVAIAEINAGEVVWRNRGGNERMSAIACREARDFRIVESSSPRSCVNRRGINGIAIAVIPVTRDDDIGVSGASSEEGCFIVGVIDGRIADVGGTAGCVEAERPGLFAARIGREQPAIHIDRASFGAASGNAAVRKGREPINVNGAIRGGRKNGGPLQRRVWRSDVGASFVIANVAHALKAGGTSRSAIGLAHALSVANASANWRGIRVALTLGHWRTGARRTGDITRHARSGASGSATDAVDAEARRTFGARAASEAIVDHGAGIAAAAYASAAAFIVGIGSGSNQAALAIKSGTAFCRRTSHARPVASIATTHVVDTIPRQTLARNAAGCAIVEFASRSAATSSLGAFVVRVFVDGNRTTRAIGALTFLCGATCIAKTRTRRVATHAVGTESGSALSRLRTRAAVAQALRQVAGARSAAFSVRAFVVRIGICGNGSTLAIDASATFGGGTGHAGAGASVSATNAVDTITGHALRCGRAGSSIVMDASA